MYDYDDVCDNLPDYFDYDEPYDCELCGFNGLVECGRCYDPCESDVSGGETILSGDGDRPLSPDSDPPGETESHRTKFGTGFGDQFPYVTYVPEPEDIGIGDQMPSVRSDRPGDPDGETDSHRTEFGAGFGDQSTYDTYAPEPDDTRDGD